MNSTKTAWTALLALGGLILAPVTVASAAGAAADKTPPTVKSTTPLNAATNVGVGVAPTATFSEAIQLSSVAATFVHGTVTVPFTTSYNTTTSTVTLTPTAALAHSTKYTLTIKAKDLAGNQMTGAAPTWSFTTDAAPPPPVDNPPSAALVASPLSGDAPLTVQLNASASTDTDATGIATYNFNWGDGTGSSGAQASALATHSYATAGNWTAAVTVTDTAGQASVASVPIVVNQPAPADDPPVASLSVTPQTGDAPLNVTADASASTDTDASPIAGYVFDFGDGSSLSSSANSTAQHTYSVAGSYAMTVTVTDTAGKSSTATAPVTATTPAPADDPPSAGLAASPMNGDAPLAVQLDASGSTDTDVSGIASYDFTWGDGTGSSGAQAGAIATHTYATAGTWTATVTVTDTANQASQASVVVTVTQPDSPPAAALTVTPQSGQNSLTVSADASASTDTDTSPIAGYVFDFGDGTVTPSQSAATAQHTYAGAGSYNLTVTVTDTAGKSSTATSPVTVTPPPPPVAKTVVSLTFDDNDADQTTAVALLKAHGMKGTFFVDSGTIGSSGNLTKAQLDAIAADGNEIGGHTLNHVDLTLQSADQAKREVCSDRSALLAMGYDVKNFAYPFGAQNATIQQDVAECGYNSARGVSGVRSPDGCFSCIYAETIPPPSPFTYNTRTPSSIKTTTTLADMQGLVTQAEDHGGGWVQLVMHHVCDPGTGCADTYSVSPTLLAQFLDWLQTRTDQGTDVKTVDQVIGGDSKPAVAGPGYPTEPGNLVKNPSLEEVSAGEPVCFEPGGYGVNTTTYAVTSDAHTGSVAERANVTAWTSGDQKLITKQDTGECALPVTAGRRYDIGLWYKGSWNGSASADLVSFYQDSTGVWKYWKDGPAVAASASYTHTTYVTPPVPAGATHMWFGLALVGVGTVITDDYSMAEHVGGPYAPGPPTVAVASATSIKVSWPIDADASLLNYTAQAFLNDVLVSSRNCTTATLTCTVGGLTTGTSYTFKVIAHGTTGYGDSPYSPPSVLIKPA